VGLAEAHLPHSYSVHVCDDARISSKTLLSDEVPLYKELAHF
jgi:hypothetical protein